MEQAVTSQHAHPNTVYHCLYGYYTLGLSRDKLARLYCKSERTISNWIRVFETNGVFERTIASRTRKYSAGHREWLYRYYQRRPLAYLDEAQDGFKREFGFGILLSSVWRIIHELGLTWKVLERRAMHVKESDIFRFARELSAIDWSHQNLVFLDEVSFDNRGMLRKRGYSLKGTTVAIRGDFQRKPRVSLLAFIGVHGLLDYGDTEGTFDRVEFVRCCQDFVYSGRVKQYPGQNSVWILDGASIHRDPEIVHWLRSIGIVPIFLPAYCPSLTQ
jgi:transposase